MAKRGYAKILHELRDHLHELSGSQLAVWLCHRLHEDANGTSFPSVPLIAKETGYDPDTVKDAHKWLRDNGWLKTISYRDSQSGKFAVPVARCTYPWLIQEATEGVKPRPGQTTGAGKTVHGSTVHGKPHPEVDTFEEAPTPTLPTVATSIPQGIASPSEAIHPEVFRPSDGSELMSELCAEVASLPQRLDVTIKQTIDHDTREPDGFNRKPEKSVDYRGDKNKFREAREEAFAEAALVEPYANPQDRPYWSQRLGRLLHSEEWQVAEELYTDLLPDNWETLPASEILALAEVAYDMQQRYTRSTQTYGLERGSGHNDAENPIRSFWNWNHTHKKGHWYFLGMAQMARSYWSTSPRSGKVQWENHEPDTCATCRKNGRMEANKVAMPKYGQKPIHVPIAVAPSPPPEDTKALASICCPHGTNTMNGPCETCKNPPPPMRKCGDCGAEFPITFHKRGYVDSPHESYCPSCRQNRSEEAYKRLVAEGKIPPAGKPGGKMQLAAFLDGEP